MLAQTGRFVAVMSGLNAAYRGGMENMIGRRDGGSGRRLRGIVAKILKHGGVSRDGQDWLWDRVGLSRQRG